MPAGRFLGVVAGLAQALRVRAAGSASQPVGDGVVEVPDRRVAPRRPAGLVSQHGELPQQTFDPATAALEADEVLAVRGAEQPAQPQRRALLSAPRQQVAGERGRHGAMAG